MKKTTLSLLFTTVMLGTASISHASVSNVFVSGTLQNSVSGIGTANTYGNMMGGMSVTAHFSNGTASTSNWNNTLLGAGVSGSWALNVCGGCRTDDTGAWTLTNYSGLGVGITSVSLDGAPGNTVFDTDYLGVGTVGTINSSTGHNFSISSSNPSPLSATATFSDAVGVGGAAAVGDVYRRLSVDFSQTAVYGSLPGHSSTTSPTYVQFTIDTDNLKIAGDIQAVPVPAAVWLLMSGLAGLGFSAKRKK
jgi:hypothetical protein